MLKALMEKLEKSSDVKGISEQNNVNTSSHVEEFQSECENELPAVRKKKGRHISLLTIIPRI